MFRPLGVIIRSSLRTYYLHHYCHIISDVNNRFLSSTWWWPTRVEICCNFKPTIKVVLTEIYILFKIDLMIPHNGMNSIKIINWLVFIMETVCVYCAVRTESTYFFIYDLLKPSGYYVTTQFNIQQLYVLPTHCIYVFYVDLRTNSDYFPIQH